eukprot:3742199-Heterocapsa_arctica.AAC.1
MAKLIVPRAFVGQFRITDEIQGLRVVRVSIRVVSYCSSQSRSLCLPGTLGAVIGAACLTAPLPHLRPWSPSLLRPDGSLPG